jgi:NADH-quinone oxidoreductase subunit L
MPEHEMPVSTETWLMIGSITMAVLGIFFAWYVYLKSKMQPAKDAARALPGVYQLLLNKYYIDELYNTVIIKPLMWLSEFFLWRFFDVWVIDGTVNGSAYITQWASTKLRKLQAGDMQVYITLFLLGVISVLAYFVLR